MSAVRVTRGIVDVSVEAVAKVPGENLRVSRAELGALWSLAEHLGGQHGRTTTSWTVTASAAFGGS
jgi:hypothetical protein